MDICKYNSTFVEVTVSTCIDYQVKETTEENLPAYLKMLKLKYLAFNMNKRPGCSKLHILYSVVLLTFQLMNLHWPDCIFTHLCFFKKVNKEGRQL